MKTAFLSSFHRDFVWITMADFLTNFLGFLFFDCLVNGVAGTLRWMTFSRKQKKSWSAYREGTDVNRPVFFGLLMLVIVLILVF